MKLNKILFMTLFLNIISSACSLKAMEENRRELQEFRELKRDIADAAEFLGELAQKSQESDDTLLNYENVVADEIKKIKCLKRLQKDKIQLDCLCLSTLTFFSLGCWGVYRYLSCKHLPHWYQITIADSGFLGATICGVYGLLKYSYDITLKK